MRRLSDAFESVHEKPGVTDVPQRGMISDPVWLNGGIGKCAERSHGYLESDLKADSQPQQDPSGQQQPEGTTSRVVIHRGLYANPDEES